MVAMSPFPAKPEREQPLHSGSARYGNAQISARRTRIAPGTPVALIGNAQAEYTWGVGRLLIGCGIPDNGV
jgi:hypothetical protein